MTMIPTFAPASTRFVCRGWTVGDKHYACLPPSRPHFRGGQCAPCFETERIGRKQRRDPWVSLNDYDLEGAAEKMTAIARMPEGAVTKVELTKRRWSRDHDACIGWGATDGPEHHACASPEGAEFDQGRCYRCHTAQVRWEAGRQAAPAALTLTVPSPAPDPDPAPTPPVPTPQEIVPRAWHKHYDCCVQCGRTTAKPASRGLCTTCYPASTSRRYTGHAGPRLDRTMTEVEQRALVDAYLATIVIPTPPAAPASPAAQEPTPVVPVPAPAVAERPWTDVLLAEVVAADAQALADAARATVADLAGEEPEWEVFAGVSNRAITEPLMSWRSDGVLSLPRVTVDLLGGAAHVELLYDAKRRWLGLRPVAAPNGTLTRAIPEREQGRGTVDLSIKALVRHFGLGDVPLGRYPVRQFGAVVAIKLPAPEAAPSGDE